MYSRKPQIYAAQVRMRDGSLGPPEWFVTDEHGHYFPLAQAFRQPETPLSSLVMYVDAEQEKFVAAAKDTYGNDDCEIDSNAALSRTDDGCWVAGWLWLTYEEAKVTEEGKA